MISEITPRDPDAPSRLRQLKSAAGLGPALTLLAAAFGVPLAFLIADSFYESSGPALVGDIATFKNYVDFLTDVFFLGIILQTVKLGAIVTAICLVLAYPVAYFLARMTSRFRGFLLFLVVSPLLISAVVRNVGWFPILSSEGLVNNVLMKLGVIATPLALLSNFTGVVIGLVHALLPFLILILTTVIARVGPELEDAAANLGAPPWRRFVLVLLPLTLPGIVAGCLLVFTVAISTYTTPTIMGGGKVLVMATYIAQQFRVVLDYPAGAAASAILMVLAVALTVAAGRLRPRGEGA